MIGYVQADDIARRWEVSIRQVQTLCKEGRVDGAVKFGNTWAIPENATKPTRTGKLKPGRKPRRMGEQFAKQTASPKTSEVEKHGR